MRFFEGPSLLLLVFLAALVVVAEIDASKPSPGVQERYETFLRQHRHNTKDVNNKYCNKMMRDRGMTSPNCKVKNSFIHASTEDIKAVCKDKGDPLETKRMSCAQFRVTTCNLKAGSIRRPCEYTQDKRPRYIVIACEEDHPVHYDEGKVIINRPKPCKK
nr:ribonuclease-like [Anolis sagrei ordinatus]